MTTSRSVRLDRSRLHGYKLVDGAPLGAKIGDVKAPRSSTSKKLGAKVGIAK